VRRGTAGGEALGRHPGAAEFFRQFGENVGGETFGRGEEAHGCDVDFAGKIVPIVCQNPRSTLLRTP